MDIVSNPVLEEPWQYFRTEISFIEKTNPVYALPLEIDEGNLIIGSVDGLRYPPNFPKSIYKYAYGTRLTYSGSPYTIDKSPNADFAETNLDMVCNQSKSAALIDHVVSDIRANNVTIIAFGNNYIFGQEYSGSGSYNCKLLNETITIQHTRHNGFNFNLSFYRS